METLVNKPSLHINVDMLGFVGNFFALLASPSISLPISAWTGLSSHLVQEIACGVRVVATACTNGPAGILESKKYEWFAPVGIPEEFAEAILQELKAHHENNLLMQRANDFSIDKILPQYLKSLFPEQVHSV